MFIIYSINFKVFFNRYRKSKSIFGEFILFKNLFDYFKNKITIYAYGNIVELEF